MTAGISLRPVERSTVRTVCALELAAGQEAYVAPPAVTVAESHYHEGSWLRAIHRGDEVVGLTWLLLAGADAPFLMRFMIAAPHQRRGLGTAALGLVVAHLRTTGAAALSLSYVPGDLEPLAFYLRCGFEATGEIRAGEHVLRLPL